MPSSRHRPTVLAAAVLVALAPALGACQPVPPGDVLAPTSVGPTAASDPAAPTAPTVLPSFDATSTVGGYAPGFPVDLLAGPDDATVLASSAVPREGLVDVSLNLSTTLGARKVLRQYAKHLGAAGFSPADDAGTSALAEHSVFTRTTGTRKASVVESVQVGVLDDGDRRLVTVSGSVAPAER